MRAVPLWLSLCVLPTAQETSAEKGTSPCRPLRPARDAALQKLLEKYEIKDRDFQWELREIRRGVRWNSYWLTFPSPLRGDQEENNTVWAKVWQPHDASRGRPAAVVLHWLAGSFDLLEVVCGRLAENGIVALMMYMPHYGPRRARGPDRRRTLLGGTREEALAGIRQAVLDARRAGDWLAARPDVDPARVGIVGVSLGAVVGALAAGVDDRFSRCGLVIGGGDLPAIIMHGSRETARQKRLLEEEGFTLDGLRELWKDIEPCAFASRMNPDDVLMINAEDDEIIPRACVERLHEAAGRPQIKWLKGGHYGIVLHLGMVLKDLVNHLQHPPALRHDPSASPPAIRVLLLESIKEVPIEIRGPFRIRGPGADERAEKLDPTTLRAEEGRLRLGGGPPQATGLVIAPDRAGDLLIDGRRYAGTITIIPAGEGNFHVVNEVDLESYIAGVVGSEMGHDAPDEALKAQAVASRTFAWTALGRDGPFDVYADTRSQVYRGQPPPGGSAERAALATRGVLLCWRGRPFKTYFSSSCGGATESAADAFGVAEIPPLAGVACGRCGGARNAEWKIDVPVNDLGLGPFTRAVVESRTAGGRARSVLFEFADGATKTVPARDLRASLGPDRLLSTRFEISLEGGVLRFSGRGWGHGCGLCQGGAVAMSREGRTFEEILRAYYPGADVRKAYGE